MHNKNISLILTLILLSFTILLINIGNSNAITKSNSLNKENEFQEYVTPNTIKIQYPISWNKTELSSINGVLFFPSINTAGVFVQNLPVSNSSKEDILNEISFIYKKFPNASLNSFKINNVNNKILQELIFNTGNNLINEKIYQFKKIDNNRLYVFTYFAKNNEYAKFIPIVSTMLHSFINLPDYIFSLSNNQPAIKQLSNNNESKTKESKNTVIPEKGKNVSSQNTTKVKLIDYTNSLNGLSFKYPNFFSKIDNNDGVYLTTNKGNVGFFIDIKSVSNKSLTDLQTEQIDYLKNNFYNLRIINSTKDMLFKIPTQMIYFNYLNNSKSFDSLQFLTIKGLKEYIFTFFSPSASFDSYLSYITEMITSTKLI